MMSDNGGEIGSFMAGFVVGGLVGAAAALVLAPQSGEETRARIASRSDEFRRLGEQRVQEYRNVAESTVHDARARVQESARDAQDRARIVLDEGRGKITDLIESQDTPSSDDSGSADSLVEESGNGDAEED